MRAEIITQLSSLLKTDLFKWLKMVFRANPIQTICSLFLIIKWPQAALKFLDKTQDNLVQAQLVLWLTQTEEVQ